MRGADVQRVFETILPDKVLMKSERLGPLQTPATNLGSRADTNKAGDPDGLADSRTEESFSPTKQWAE